MINKKFNSERICSKKYLIAKKIFSTKESFQCFYRKIIPVPVILTDFLKKYSDDSNDSHEKISRKEILMKKIKCKFILKKKTRELLEIE